MAAPGDETPRVRVAALILVDGKVVLVRHRKGHDSYYLLPGGGLERGETLSEALVREVLEETGLSVSVGRPLLLSDTIAPSGTRHLVNITFEAHVVGGATEFSSSDPRVCGVALVCPRDLPSLDLRPPIAGELEHAISLGSQFHAAYLGSRYIEVADSG